MFQCGYGHLMFGDFDSMAINEKIHEMENNMESFKER